MFQKEKTFYFILFIFILLLVDGYYDNLSFENVEDGPWLILITIPFFAVVYYVVKFFKKITENKSEITIVTKRTTPEGVDFPKDWSRDIFKRISVYEELAKQGYFKKESSGNTETYTATEKWKNLSEEERNRLRGPHIPSGKEKSFKSFKETVKIKRFKIKE